MAGLLDTLVTPPNAKKAGVADPFFYGALLLSAAMQGKVGKKLLKDALPAARKYAEEVGRAMKTPYATGLQNPDAYAPITRAVLDLAGGPVARGLLSAKAASPTTVSALGATGSRYDDAVKRGAQRVGVSEDVYKNLEAEGFVSPQVPPIGKRGQDLQFPSGYSKGLKIPVPDLEYMDQTLTRRDPKKMGPRDLQIGMEGLLGKTLVPMPGDRTSRDVITGFMGQKIRPYQVEGGYRYMPDEGGWASGDSVITRYKTIFDDLEGQGVGVGTPMAGTGSDYAKAGIDLIYRRFDVDGMPKKTKAALKEEINIEIAAANKAKIKAAKKNAKDDKTEYVEPDIIKPFKGFDGNERTRFNAEPELRKAVMQALDKDRSRKLPGAPDAVAVRHAITDDRFREMRRGASDPLSGFDFMEFPAGQRVRKSPHSSYPVHLPGNYLGGLIDTPVPRSVLFPSFTKQMYKEGRDPSEWNYMFDRLKPTETVTPQLVDDVLNFQKRMLR